MSRFYLSKMLVNPKHQHRDEIVPLKSQTTIQINVV